MLFISHKFEEIFDVADRYAVFRDGAAVGQGHIRDVTRDSLISMMVGRSVDHIFPKVDVPIGEELFRVDGLSRGEEFADISFALRRGEILGVYGLVGAGRSEVCQAVFGLTRSDAGRVTLEGRDLRIRSPEDAIGAGIAYVPEDRQIQGGICVSLSAATSFCRRSRISRIAVHAPVGGARLGRHLCHAVADQDLGRRSAIGGVVGR